MATHSASFKLDDSFINGYANKKAPFGYNGLGEFVYYQKYSRLLNGKKEQWYQTVRRVVEGCYQIQMNHINELNLGWNPAQGQRSAREMYDLIFNFKFVPPGRGLWAMGTDIINKKGLYVALNNCAFISTEDIDKTLSEPFTFLMDISMLGGGVGFDTEGAGKIKINAPIENIIIQDIHDSGKMIYTFCPSYVFDQGIINNKRALDYFKAIPGEIPLFNDDVKILTGDIVTGNKYIIIPDTREGWVQSVGILLDSYFKPGQHTALFDYSQIRPKGQPLKTFGGISSGPEPLIELHHSIRKLLDPLHDQIITARTIVDLMNVIGISVVSGNVRRSAEMAIGKLADKEFLDLKDYNKNPDRQSYGWMSNNTVIANIGDNYKDISAKIIGNGEPGICWLDNMRKYSRMDGHIDNKDILAQGMNPCGEMTACSGTVCCLSEVFIENHKTMKEFLRTLKFAYLYGKTVTLGVFHIPLANKVQLKQRRIGLSLTGIAQFLAGHSIEDLHKWTTQGYDEVQKWDKVYSDWLAVPLSIKTTTIKPSGTVSLLAGATPGIHFPESEYYIRRVRVENNSPMLSPLKSAGYHIEQDLIDKYSSVVDFPISESGVKCVGNVSIWEQLHLCSCLQEWWSDNQVSATIKFKNSERGCIEPALNYFQYRLKCVSFLPMELSGYKQMPIEPITKEKYMELTANLKPINYAGIKDFLGDAIGDKYCTSDVCLNLDHK